MTLFSAFNSFKLMLISETVSFTQKIYFSYIKQPNLVNAQLSLTKFPSTIIYYGATTFCMTTFSMTTNSIMDLIVTLSINDTQQHST